MLQSEEDRSMSQNPYSPPPSLEEGKKDCHFLIKIIEEANRHHFKVTPTGISANRYYNIFCNFCQHKSLPRRIEGGKTEENGFSHPTFCTDSGGSIGVRSASINIL